MAALYLDKNVALPTRGYLQALGHQATSARDEGLEFADDDVHLSHASQNGWILVTHDRNDFELLHGAWRRWSVNQPDWSPHQGILLIPQRPIWLAEQAADAIHRFVQRGLPLPNEMYAARGPSDADRWYRRIVTAQGSRWVPC